jgi:hypothetical protein
MSTFFQVSIVAAVMTLTPLLASANIKCETKYFEYEDAGPVRLIERSTSISTNKSCTSEEVDELCEKQDSWCSEVERFCSEKGAAKIERYQNLVSATCSLNHHRLLLCAEALQDCRNR